MSYRPTDALIESEIADKLFPNCPAFVTVFMLAREKKNGPKKLHVMTLVGLSNKKGQMMTTYAGIRSLFRSRMSPFFARKMASIEVDYRGICHYRETGMKRIVEVKK